MTYEEVLKKFEEIELEIKNSNHDALAYEDYEASQDEIDECLKDFGLGGPFWMGKRVILPEQLWPDSFPNVNDKYTEVEVLMETPEYKKLEEIYVRLHDKVVDIATEMSAYYARESEEEEAYYNSMRGPL